MRIRISPTTTQMMIMIKVRLLVGGSSYFGGVGGGAEGVGFGST